MTVQPHRPPQPANETRAIETQRRLNPHAEDYEFLPAVIEIIETPPSPVRIALIYYFAALVAVALIWSWFGRLDVVAIGQGKIQPPGRVKVIQAIETGKVASVAVANGRRVAAGEVLVTFDASEARADVEALEGLVQSLNAEIDRRNAAAELGAKTPAGRGSVNIRFGPSLQPEIRQRELRTLEADLAQLDSAIATLKAQVSLKQSERQRLIETVAAQSTLVRTLRERVEMRAKLAGTGFGSRASLIDANEMLFAQETTLANMKGQLREADSALDVLAREQEKTTQGFLTENTQKRGELGRTLDDAAQRLTKARARLDHMTLRSPIDGMVVASSVYSAGQVATVGQELLRVVPLGDTLEIEAYLPNKDIGFVRQNQQVSIKIDTFPYTRYGTVSGVVRHISHDAIPLPDAQQVEGSPARPSESPTFAGAQRTHNLVFPVTVTLDSTSLPVNGQMVALTPGMTCTVEIRTGSRRIIEYLLSPIVETTSEALRER